MSTDDQPTATPDPAVTSLPALPTVEPPPTAYDPVRDRLRVVLDRAIYAGALVSVVLLSLRGKLDLQTLAAILLVAGVRPHNLFEAMRGGSRPAVLLPLLLENLRGGTWLAR